MNQFVAILRVMLFVVFSISSLAVVQAQAQNGSSLCAALSMGETAGEIARLGHGQAQDLAISPSGQLIAVATTTGVWLYDAKTTEPLQSLETQPSQQAWSITWSPDGSKLAVAYFNAPTLIWDIQQAQVMLSIEGVATQVAWSPDGTVVATVDPTGSVTLWDAATGDLLKSYSSRVKKLDWSPDGSQLLIADNSRNGLQTRLYLWEIGTDQEPDYLGGSEGNAESSILAWSPDGTRLAVGNNTATGVEIWNVREEQVSMTLEIEFVVFDMDWSPEGSYLSLGGLGNEKDFLYVWDMQGEDFQLLTGHTQKVTDVAWSTDNTFLASISDDGTLRTWEPKTGDELVKQDRYWTWIGNAIWMPNSTDLAASYIHADGSYTVAIWDIPSGDVIWKLEQLSSVFRLAPSPDGSLLAISSNNVLQIWDIQTNSSPILTINTSGSTSVVWSPDGNQLATLDPINERLDIWNATTGQEDQTFDIQGIVPEARITWTINGLRWVSVMDSDVLAVWEATQEEPLFMLEDFSSSSFPFLLPNGTILAANFQLWDIESKHSVEPFDGSGSQGAGSPDETCITSTSATSIATTGSLNNVINLWDVNKGQQAAILEGHGSFEITSLAWSFDNLHVASTSTDGTAKIWGVLP